MSGRVRFVAHVDGIAVGDAVRLRGVQTRMVVRAIRSNGHIVCECTHGSQIGRRAVAKAADLQKIEPEISN